MNPSATPGHHPATWTDRLSWIAFVAAASFLVFVLGAVAAEQRWPLARVVCDASRAAQALLAQREVNEQTYPEYLWFPSVHAARGLARCELQSMYPGYTLYCSADAAQATLLDSQGTVLHRWNAPFSTVWPSPRQVQGWTSDRAIFIRRAHAFPNGDLLALYESPAHTPNGCGLAKLDLDSRVLWTLDENAHHDFTTAEDGRIFVLTHAVRQEPLEAWPNLARPYIEDFLTVLDAEGRVLQRLSLMELLGASPFHRSIVTFTDQLGDVLHSNSVHLVGSEFASHHAGVTPGDVMICLRNLNLVVVVNILQETIPWATTGPWRLPHDADPLPDGSILIFDNCFSAGPLHGSRVLLFDVLRGMTVWRYGGNGDEPLRSDIRSCQQLLANGNVLITESDRGRILEVNPQKEIVWEYVHPVRGGDADELIPVVAGARRYDPSELPFVADGGQLNPAERLAIEHNQKE